MAPAVALGALLVVDAVLISWALRPAPAEVVDAVVSTRSPTPSATSGSPSPSATAPSPSPSPSAPSLEVRPLTRLVAASGSRAAWVADTGSCDKPGRIRVTTDGGASWSTRAAPAEVLRVRAQSPTAAFVTGGDADCRLRLWSTSDGGSSWSGAQSAARAWSRTPGDATTVHLPSGTTTAPCADGADVVDLAGLDTRTALVLCETGQVRSTGDAGASWATAFTVEDALAIGIAPDGSAGVVVRADAGCDGVVAVAVRNGEPVLPGTCVESSPRSGRVAVASSGTRWWLVAGDEVFTSDGAEGPWTPTDGSLAKG